MINSEHAPQHFGTCQVVYSQVATSLVFVFEKAETFAFTGFSVANQIQMSWIAELAEYGDNVTFTEIEGKSAYVDPCCVFVVRVPGR